MRPGMDGAPLIGMLKCANLSIGLGKVSNPLNELLYYFHIYAEDIYRAVSYLLPVIKGLGLPMSPAFYIREEMLDMAAGRMRHSPVLFACCRGPESGSSESGRSVCVRWSVRCMPDIPVWFSILSWVPASGRNGIF